MHPPLRILFAAERATPPAASPRLALTLVRAPAELEALPAEASFDMLALEHGLPWAAAVVERLPSTLRVLLVDDPDTAQLDDDGHDAVLSVDAITPSSLLLLARVSRERRASRQEAVAALEESEARFRQMADNIREVFWLIDLPSRKLVYVSSAFEEIWGRTCESLYERPWSWVDPIHPDDRERVVEAAKTRQAGGGFREEYRIRRPDGSERWILDTAFPVRNEAGQVIRIVGVASDITEQKAAQAELRRSQEQLVQAQKMEAIGRLAGGIAHDFNNMLTAISGYTELMLHRLREDDPLRADVEEVRSAASRAEALTQQLLAFSRRQVLKPRVLELNGVITDLERILQRLLGDQVELRLSLDPAIGNILADPTRLEQVLVNLGVNARHAMPNGGRCTISTQRCASHPALEAPPGDYVLLTVEDDGVGMDAELLSHIFEPFFTTRPHGEGTGLGLSTVYGIVQQSGGFIGVESQPGEGSRFRILLPAIDAPAERSAETPTQAGVGGHETILLVEDEDLVRRMLNGILTRSGYRVLQAVNGAEALEVAAACNADIHLLVTDVMMPNMGGRELARRLQEQRPGVKVLYISGYSDNALADAGITDALPFLQKPFKPSSLTHKVRELLDGASPAIRASRR